MNWCLAMTYLRHTLFDPFALLVVLCLRHVGEVTSA